MAPVENAPDTFAVVVHLPPGCAPCRPSAPRGFAAAALPSGRESHRSGVPRASCLQRTPVTSRARQPLWRRVMLRHWDRRQLGVVPDAF